MIWHAPDALMTFSRTALGADFWGAVGAVAHSKMGSVRRGGTPKF